MLEEGRRACPADRILGLRYRDLRLPHFRSILSLGSNFTRVNYFDGALAYEIVTIERVQCNIGKIIAQNQTDSASWRALAFKIAKNAKAYISACQNLC